MSVKVVWVTHFSNKEIREKVFFRKRFIEVFFRTLMKRPMSIDMDYCFWVTKSIKEFEKFKDVEVHIVSPLYGMVKRNQEFDIKGVYYHFFRPDDDSFFYRILKNIFKKLSFSKHHKNRLFIKRKIEDINPSVVHFIGAENPYYSLAALDLDNTRPILVSLQTLMADPDFLGNYSISKDVYDYRVNCEKQVIKRADYICSSIPRFNHIIRTSIKPSAVFINLKLLYAEERHYNPDRKTKYDFVYFARNINKACDIVIAAFKLFHQEFPNATLFFVGGYDSTTKQGLDDFIDKNELNNNVFFSGELPSHDDVINEIQKAKYALLPLKIDVISTTLLEAMLSGLPIVSTVTPGTPELNKNRDSILLGEKDDISSIVTCMRKLYQDDDLACRIRENAFLTVDEQYNNYEEMRQWADCYKDLTENHELSDRFIVK